MKSKRLFIAGSALLAIFIIFTVLITLINVKPSGSSGADVGFSGINSAFFDYFGENGELDKLSDVLLLLSFVYVFGFALMGAIQLIKRRSLCRVGREILLMGALMVILALVYAVFELLEINCRPILVDGALEASYPSTHVLFSTVIFVSSILLIRRMLENRRLFIIASGITAFLAALAIFSRALCGAHWLTDIVASLILASSLITLFAAVLKLSDEIKDARHSSSSQANA